jgi:HPt (histidine-containing phosphotransfer) domain-containing protein
MVKNLSIIDLDGVKQRLDGDLELWVELVQMFVDTHEEYLFNIATPLQQDQTEATMRALHTLKGALANIGAAKAAEIAREFEMIAKKNELEAVKNRYPELESAVKEIPAACATLGFKLS